MTDETKKPEGLESSPLKKLLAAKGDDKSADKWQAAIRAVFDAAGSMTDEPLMFECRHCGGYHRFTIHCANCDIDIDATQAMEMGSIDKHLVLGLCKKCLSVSVALYKCHGIDPSKRDIQASVAEGLKVIPGGKK